MSNLAVLAIHLADHGWAGGWHGPWWVIFPVLWIVIAGTVIWLVERKRRPSSIMDRPLEVLADRYARGEIDVNEYRTRRDEIMSKVAP